MTRSEQVFEALKIIPNRYELVNRGAHLSRGMRHVYRDSVSDSINAALSRIAGVEEPEPLPSPAWRRMLQARIALRQAKQEAEQLTTVSGEPKQEGPPTPKPFVWSVANDPESRWPLNIFRCCPKGSDAGK